MSESGARFTARRLSMEEAVARQMDRIAYLRSGGLPWSEAVFQLRDMLEGLTDPEFFDGVPDDRREDCTDEDRAAFAPYGWDTFGMRAVRGPGDRPIYRPTPENLSQALRILMRLASRRGLTWRSKPYSRLGPWEGATEEDEPEGQENGFLEH